MRLFFKLTPHFRFAVRSAGARCGGGIGFRQAAQCDDRFRE